MSKVHKNIIGSGTEKLYDSISFGEKIFVEEVPHQSIRADYENLVNTFKGEHAKKIISTTNEFSFGRFLDVSIRVLSVSALAFIGYSILGGTLENSKFALKPMGWELGITLGIFASVSIFTILFLFSKTKIKVYVENGILHIKSFRGLNHAIPLENIEDCRINIFHKADSIKSFIPYSQFKINLESGLLITFKDGKSLLIASSNSTPANKNYAFN